MPLKMSWHNHWTFGSNTFKGEGYTGLSFPWNASFILERKKVEKWESMRAGTCIIFQHPQSHFFGETQTSSWVLERRHLRESLHDLGAWNGFEYQKDLTKVSRKHYRCSCKPPLITGKIVHHAVDCVEAIVWTHHSTAPNDQIYIWRVGSKVAFGWGNEGIRRAAQNWCYGVEMCFTSLRKRSTCHSWYSYGN